MTKHATGTAEGGDNQEPVAHLRVPAWAAWGIVALPTSVVVLFLCLRRSLHLSEFDVLSLRRLQSTLGFPATFDAAKSHWATSIFLSTVVMIAVAGLGTVCVLRAKVPSNLKLAIFVTSLAIPLVIWCLKSEAIPAMQRMELELMKTEGQFDASSALMAFLQGLYGAAFLLACGLACVVHDASASGATIGQITASRTVVREALGLVTAWHVLGVVGIGLFHRLARTCINPEHTKIFDDVVQASNVFSGALYTALLAAIFLPAELLFRNAALTRASRAGEASEPQTQAWLSEHGFDVSVVKSLAQLAAMFAPLFAGALQGLVAAP